jgi:hypothetical protein
MAEGIGYLWLVIILLVAAVIYRAKRKEDEELKHLYRIEKFRKEHKEDNDNEV